MKKKGEKVKYKKVEYIEVVRQFTGLKFHCPKCDKEFHLDIAEINFEPRKILK